MFNSNSPSLADIAAVTGNNRSSDGMWGGDGWWAIIIFAIIFGWGGFGNGFGGYGNGAGAATTAGYATQADLQRGFDNQSVMNKLNALENGLCSLGYDQLGQMNAINQNVSNTGAAITQAINADTVAGMQNANAISSQLASCCCENREAIADLKYNTATQSSATNNLIQSTTRDVIDSQNAGTRAILDFLCQDKISTLQSENQSLKLAASQANQNAVLQAAMDANTAEILRRTAPLPVPSYTVANPYTGVYGAYGCGCSA